MNEQEVFEWLRTNLTVGVQTGQSDERSSTYLNVRVTLYLTNPETGQREAIADDYDSAVL